MSQKRSAVPIRWATLGIMLIVGIACGLVLPSPQSWRLWLTGWLSAATKAENLVGGEATAEEDHDHDHEHGADVVVVSDRVRASLGLVIAPVALDSYSGMNEVHGFVRELPGTQDMKVSSRYAGVVSEVFAVQGMAVRPGDPICRIELVGEDLARAQIELLDSLTQLEIIAVELERLRPLVDAGGVTGRRVLELEYEQQRLRAKAETRRQELLLRGLALEQVQEIESKRRLIQQVTVTVPENLLPPQLNESSYAHNFTEQFYVESISAKTGTFLAAGADLVHLAFHEVLAVEGHAFEKDLPTLRELMARGGTVDLSIGPEALEVQIHDLPVAYLSNHADGATNSFPFYVYFSNRSTSANGVDQTGAGESSLWKPGQRAHVHIPQQTFQNKIVLPREAVVLDGVRHLIFRRLEIDPADTNAGTTHSHGDEFEPVEVQLLFQDRSFAVIEPNEQLQPGTWVAKRGASHLYFAWQAQQASGGGGHDHDH